jgi:GNAT superfamily N-acetyltransferase
MISNVDSEISLGLDLDLPDGTSVRLRPITPGDAEALQIFHRGLSNETIYLRYFYPHPVLSAKEIEHLTEVDGLDRLALVVENAGQLVAVGRYDRLPASSDAEVAFVVADAFQHHGIGTLLLDRLAEAARSVGITRFLAEVLAGNRKMLDVFVASGFPTKLSYECGVAELWMSIG